MPRFIAMSTISRFVSAVICAATFATPVQAGMTQDLADCTAADRMTSVDACTRVMNSGRLPKNQLYIGHFNRGSAHFHSGSYDKALSDFDKSIDYNPGYADTYYKRALVQHERGNRERSLADLDRYLEKKGDVAEAHINRARLFRRRSELNQAFSELQKASALDPGEIKAQILRALVLSDLGEQGPARIEADKAVTAGPDNADAYYARATVAFRDANYAAALTDIEKALALKATFPAVLMLRGRIEEQQGEKDKAAASFRKVLEGAPKSLDARAAQDDARARLATLEPLAAVAPVSNPAPQLQPQSDAAASVARVSECRRFIPSAQTTVAVECPK